MFVYYFSGLRADQCCLQETEIFALSCMCGSERNLLNLNKKDKAVRVGR